MVSNVPLTHFGGFVLLTTLLHIPLVPRFTWNGFKLKIYFGSFKSGYSSDSQSQNDKRQPFKTATAQRWADKHVINL